MNDIGDGDTPREVLHLNFNQTSTALSVGTRTGYTLYDLDQVHECKPTFESRDREEICIIERNFSTSLIAYVKLASPRNLILYNYKKGTAIIEKLFPNTVLSVKLNRKNVVVCLEDSIHILYTMELGEERTHVVTGTPANAKGLLALTAAHGNSLLAYPGSAASGDVQIFDCTERHAKITIPAHASQLAAIGFSDDSQKLATASIKGTVIRVFQVTNGDVLFEFRRGVKRCVEIQSLCFSSYLLPEFLCASSNTETIHIFKLCPPPEPVVQGGEEEVEGWMEMFGRVLTESAKYLPTQVSGVLTQQRCFAYVHLPFTDQKTTCTISRIQGMNYILVASVEGFLYIYELNTEEGGSCHLVKQHRLEGPRLPLMEVPGSRDLFSAENSAKAQQTRESQTDPTPCLKPQVNPNTIEEADSHPRNGIHVNGDSRETDPFKLN